LRIIGDRPAGNQRGFTMVELLVACAVLGLVLAGLTGLLAAGQQAYLFGSTQVDAQQNVRMALDRMVKEIREAGYYPQGPDTAPANCPGPLYPLYPTGPACYLFVPITAPGPTSFGLQFDWNGDGVSQPAGLVNDGVLCRTGAPCRGERVTYAFSAGNLTRREVGADGAPVVIASGLTDVTFVYRDAGNLVTAALDRIRTVEISLTAQSANHGAWVTMVDRVRLRNR
jgi:prepilin-type N-terminal cleavage/methylation domain-containing protein